MLDAGQLTFPNFGDEAESNKVKSSKQLSAATPRIGSNAKPTFFYPNSLPRPIQEIDPYYSYVMGGGDVAPVLAAMEGPERSKGKGLINKIALVRSLSNAANHSNQDIAESQGIKLEGLRGPQVPALHPVNESFTEQVGNKPEDITLNFPLIPSPKDNVKATKLEPIVLHMLERTKSKRESEATEDFFMEVRECSSPEPPQEATVASTECNVSSETSSPTNPRFVIPSPSTRMRLDEELGKMRNGIQEANSDVARERRRISYLQDNLERDVELFVKKVGSVVAEADCELRSRQPLERKIWKENYNSPVPWVRPTGEPALRLRAGMMAGVRFPSVPPPDRNSNLSKSVQALPSMSPRRASLRDVGSSTMNRRSSLILY